MLLLLGTIGWLYPRIPTGDCGTEPAFSAVDGLRNLRPPCADGVILPMGLGTRKASSSLNGFIAGFGYIGAAPTTIVSGWLIDAFSWKAAFNAWSVSAIVAGILMTALWNYKPKRGKYL